MKKMLVSWAKRIGWTLFVVVLTLNVFIVLSGRFYLYKGVYSTYLQGENSPTIYDKDKFYSSKLSASSNKQPWKMNVLDHAVVPQKFFKYAEKWKTTSLLVIKNDTLIFEKYWGNHHPKTVSNSFSAAKTVISLLIGIAIEEGKINSLDDSVSKYLPAFSGKGKEKITIRYLLMMASGLDWGESGTNPLSENAESYYGSDLKGLIYRQQVEREPGKLFLYQSGNSQLLGFVLAKATGKSISAYAREKLWQPIGAESDAFWSLDKENGDEKAFCCLYSTTRDFARIGHLLANNGKWNTKQVVPEWYIQEMMKNPNMETEENVPNTRYGLHVWTYVSNGHAVYYCRGIKGQYIISIPDEKLIIVRTGNKRAPNVEIPENKSNDSAFIRRIQNQIGHPTDLFEYIKMGREIASKSH